MYDSAMNISGRVQNGVIVLEGSVSLPEGARVRVSLDAADLNTAAKARIELPLVRYDQPGSIALTNEIVADILDNDDAAPRH
jgi:hypothetical protein